MRRRPLMARPAIALTLPRGALLGSTALQAAFVLAFALPALAQPAPNARPQGGAVVAGQASIAHGGTTTTITQSTDRAAINWQSFDVGSRQAVVFQQPGASSVTLNRVTTPRPSEIAGRISANGSVVIINSAGVVFHQGAQVEAQSFVASTADTTNAAFMAGGRLRLDQPGRPGARIENRGNITVRDTGLAALVAPSVANSGTVRARLGTVVLAGAETHTIDLHGDGLVAFDVTSQVRTAPLGPDGRPVAALVTNTGTVLAEGGTVLLTAQAVDGLVQNLVSAGGTIRADSAGARAGMVEIAGVGGSIRLDGTVAAAGRRPGEAGGTIVANATGDVMLGPTARVVANGRAGGGTVALGTTAERARAQGGGVGAGDARRTVVAAGARVRADATERGDGGRVAVIGREQVTHAGAISARGGPQGGDGGRVEVSSRDGFALTGTVDTLAPQGSNGTLLIDPRDLSIVNSSSDEIGTNPASPQVGAGDGGTTDDAELTIATLETLLDGGNVRLEATRDLIVSKAFSHSDTGNSLTLAAGRNLIVNRALTLKGDINLFASDPTITGATVSGQVRVNAALKSTDGAVYLRAFGSSGEIVFGTASGGNVGSAQAGTRLTMVGNAMTLPAASETLKAPIVEIAPNAGVAMKLGAGASGGLALADLSSVKAESFLRLGGATLPNAAPPPDTVLTNLASSTTLVGDLALSNVNLDLRAVGAVSRSAGRLSGVAVLAGAAGTGFAMDGVGHGVGAISPITSAAGRISLHLSGNQTLNTNIPDAPGGFHVRADGNLVVDGSINRAGEVALTGATITLNPGFTIKSTGAAVSLLATSGAIELKGGVEALTRISVRADTFTPNGNTLTTGAGGVVERARNTSGAFAITAAEYALGANTTTLRLGGATAAFETAPQVTATSLSLNADPAAAAGFTTLDLRASGAVAQTVTIDLTGRTLAGVAGSFDLTDAANVIPTLGALRATGGNLGIISNTTLSITGVVEATDQVGLIAANGLTVQAGGAVSGDDVGLSTTVAGGLLLNGGVTAGATLELTTAGAVSGTGAVSAALLKGSAGSLDLGGGTAAQITKIGDFTAQGGFALAASGALEVSGNLVAGAGAAGNVVLGAETLSVSGSVTAGVAATQAGSITLDGADQASIGGNLRAHRVGGVGGAIAVGSSAGSVEQTAGTIRADAGLTLTAATDITQSGGVLDAAQLIATATGGAMDLAGANRLDSLGALSAGGSITIGNAIALGIDGPVRGGLSAAAGALAEVDITAAGAMTVNGAVSAGGGTVAGRVSLTSEDGFLRSGAASAGRLTVNSGASTHAEHVAGTGGRVALTAESATNGAILVDEALVLPSGGEFALSGRSVTIGLFNLAASLTAPQGRIGIQSDALSFLGFGGARLIAADGTVAIAPRLAGRTVSLGGAGGDLALDASLFPFINVAGGGNAGVLELGRLDGGDLTVVASTAAPSVPTLRLLSGGTITANAGVTLKVNRLEGEAGGAITLDGVGHDVQVLGALKAGTSLAFRAGGNLDVDGATSAGTDLRLETGLGGTLRVVPGGSLTAGNSRVITLIGDQMDFAGAVSAPGGRIEILPQTAGRAMSLAGGGGLALSAASLGQLGAGTLLLGARQGGAAVAGDLTVGGIATLGGVNRLRLLLKGDVTDGGVGTGIVVERLGDATVLAGVNANSISLKSGDNRFGFVDNFDVKAGMTITSGRAVTFAGALEAGQAIALRGRANDPAALTVGGSVSAGTQGGLATGFAGSVDIATTQGGLTIGSGGTVLARNGSVAISGAGGATSIANGASVTADGSATLAGNGGVTLAGSLGAQSGIGITASGGATAFDLAGTGSLTTTTGDVALTITGAATLAGTLTASAGNLVLSGGAISGAGAVTANAVTGTATSLALTGAANAIPVLGPFSATGGGIALNTTTALTLAGTVSATGAVTLDATSITIPVTAQLLAPGQVVTLTSDTGVTGPGVVTAGEINADGGTGAVDLPNAGNAIAGLGTLQGDTFIALTSTLPLSITGLVEAPDGVAISAAGLNLAAGGTVRATAPGADVALTATAGDLTLAGTVTAPDRVDLFANGLLSQTGGSVTGGVVAAEGATVTQAGGTMEATAGNLEIRGGSATIGGTVRALALGADLRIETKGGDLGLTGTIAAERLLSLIAGGALSQTGGSATGGTVTTLAGGALTQAAGSLTSTLGSLEITGASVNLGGTVESARDLTVTATTGALALGGTATAARDAFLTAQTLGIDVGGTLAGRDVALTASGGVAPVPGAPVAGRDIAIGGGVTASRTLTITAQGAAAAAGVLKAGTLTGATGGNADFTGANAIVNLGPFAAGSLLRLDNARALTVAGANSATGSIALTVAGALVLDAGVPFTLDAPAIALSATSITQPAGAIRTGALTAKATGGISLEQAGNAISGLGAGAGGDVRVVTSTGLAIGADVIGDNLALTANGGAIEQSAGTIGWTGTATLTALGGITQTGGTLDGGAVGVLTGSAGGAVSLTQAGNVVPRLGAFAAGGGFALTTTGDLAVLGNVAAGAGVLSLDAGGALNLGTAALSGASGSLVAGGDVTQLAGGSLTLGGALDIAAAGAVALGGATAAGATTINGASFDLDAAASLSLTGLLALTTTGDAVLDGSVTAVGATIGAASLRQAAGGTMALGAGAFDVTATGAVALDGSVSAGAATLVTAGFTQAAGGALAFTGPLGLTAGGDVTLGGSLAAAGATLGTGAFTLAAGGSMAIGGPLALTASGSIVLDGAVTAASATLSGTSLSQAVGGSLGVTGLLTLSATGDVALNGATSAGSATLSTAGFALNGGATLTVGGALGLTATGDVVLDGTITAGAATLSGGAVSQAVGGSLAVTNDLGLTATGDVAFNGAVSAGGAASLSTAGFTLASGATLDAGGLLTLTAAGDVVLDGAVTAGAATLATGGFSQAVTGRIALGGSSTLAATGDVAIGGAFDVLDMTISAASFTLRPTASTTANTLGVTTVGDTVIDGSLVAGAAIAFDTAAFRQAATGFIEVTGSFDLTASGNVVIGGRVLPFTGRIAAAALDVATGGGIDVMGPLDVTTTGDIVVRGFLGGFGSTTLNSAGLTVASGGSVYAGTAMALTVAGDLVADGELSAGPATILAGRFLQGGTGRLLAGPLDLTATGDVVLDGRVTSTGLARLAGAGLTQAAAGLLEAGGALEIAAGDVVLDGAVTAASATLSTAGFRQAAGATFDVAGTLGLTATGDVVLDGTVTAGSATLATAGLTQAAGGSLAVTGALGLTATGDVVFDGAVAAGSATLVTAGLSQAAGGTLDVTGGPLTLTASGDVVLDGIVRAGRAALATGNLTQSAGGQLLVSGPLTLDATGDARLDGTVRATTGDLAATGDLTQAAGGDLRVTGLLTLAAGRDLVLDGTVIADEALVSAGRDLTQAATGLMNASGLRDLSAGRDIILDGRVVGDPLQLTAGRNLLQSAGGAIEASSIILDVGGDASLLGNVTMRLVTGDVGGALVMDGPATLVDRLSALTAGSRMVVEADGALLLDGVLSAPSMIIRSVGPMTVGELTLYTGGVPFTQPPPGSVTQSRLPEPVPGAPGAVLETRDITMTIDSITIQTLGGSSGGNATLALRLPATGGRMTFRTIDGPTTDLTLDLGSGGYAAGLIALRNLTVLGFGGSTDLEGTIAGIGGQGAAGRAGLGPRLTPEYRINSCPLSSINCVQFVVRLATPADPIRDLGIVGARDEREDPDIFVPNVAERDF